MEHEKNGVKVQLSVPQMVMALAAIFGIMLTIFGASYNLIVAKTQTEVNQEFAMRSIASLQKQMDVQLELMNSISTRLTKMEVTEQFFNLQSAELSKQVDIFKQAIAEMKLSIEAGKATPQQGRFGQ